jgi:hypothetical protein
VILEGERAKNEAIQRLNERKKKIELEISYWPRFISSKSISSPAKREKFFNQRAKLLGFTIDEYYEEIVKKCEGKVIVI